MKRRRRRGAWPLWIAVVAVIWTLKQRDRSPRPARSSAATPTAAAPAPASEAPRTTPAEATAQRDGAGPMVDIPLDTPLAGQEPSLARNLYFILDGSGSMRSRPDRNCGGDQTFDTKLAGVQWALDLFLGKVAPEINLGLYVFDDAGRREVVALGTDRVAFARAVDQVRTGGRTPLAAAIRHGTDRLVDQYKKQLGYGDFRLVVITDGKARDLPDAAAYAGRYGMPIHAIGLCIGEDRTLRSVAASYRAADRFEELASGLEALLVEPPELEPATFDAVAGRDRDARTSGVTP